MVKTQEEIGLIAESSRLVAHVLQVLKEHVAPGVTTNQLDRMAEEIIAAHDAAPAFKGYIVHGIPYPATLCASLNDAVVHGLPNDTPLHEGDIISLDVGVLKNGFYGDGAITCAVGEIDELKARLMRVTEEALWMGIEQAVDGNRIYDISRAIQRHVESNGFSVTRELVGHGIGRHLHEEPSVPNFVPSPFQRHNYRNTQLRDGMTMCIEPMVNAGTYRVKTAADKWTVLTQDGKPSAHFEHTVVINGDNPIVLTKTDEELMPVRSGIEATQQI